MKLKPYERKAHYHETDAMGIIHHSNYIKWFEESRMDFMQQIGFEYEKVESSGVDFAVLGVSCEYKGMVRFDENVLIHNDIIFLTPSRMTVRYRVVNAATGEVKTIGTSNHCCVDRATKRPVSIKKALPELYEIFLEVLVKPE